MSVQGHEMVVRKEVFSVFLFKSPMIGGHSNASPLQ